MRSFSIGKHRESKRAHCFLSMHGHLCAQNGGPGASILRICGGPSDPDANQSHTDGISNDML